MMSESMNEIIASDDESYRFIKKLMGKRPK